MAFKQEREHKIKNTPVKLDLKTNFTGGISRPENLRFFILLAFVLANACFYSS